MKKNVNVNVYIIISLEQCNPFSIYPRWDVSSFIESWRYRVYSQLYYRNIHSCTSVYNYLILRYRCEKQRKLNNTIEFRTRSDKNINVDSQDFLKHENMCRHKIKQYRFYYYYRSIRRWSYIQKKMQLVSCSKGY